MEKPAPTAKPAIAASSLKPNLFIANMATIGSAFSGSSIAGAI